VERVITTMIYIRRISVNAFLGFFIEKYCVDPECIKLIQRNRIKHTHKFSAFLLLIVSDFTALVDLIKICFINLS